MNTLYDSEKTKYGNILIGNTKNIAEFSKSYGFHFNHTAKNIFKLSMIFFAFLFLNGFKVSAQTAGNHCKLNCRDTIVCFSLPDSLVKLPKPTYTSDGLQGGSSPCLYDSIWNTSPGVFPVGTTVVTWYVRSIFGFIDSCTQNIIRKAPSNYNIIFSTFPPIIGGVINICNGQSILFTDNSTGTTGRLWNFGNGFYSSNAIHTEPGWHYPPGTYYDTLTVFDDCGNPHDTAWQVVVDSASGPDIFCISVVCPGDTVTYHTNAVCTSYTWSVAGGTFLTIPLSTSDSATVVWGTGSQGTISLIVSGCTPPLTCPFGTTKIIHIVPAALPIAGDTVTCAESETCYHIECIPGNTHTWTLTPAFAGTITGQGTSDICIKWASGFFGTVNLQVNYQNVLTGSGCSLPYGCTHDEGCGGSGHLTIHIKPIFGITGPQRVCPNVTSLPFNGVNLTNNTIEPLTQWKLVTPIPTTIYFSSTSQLNSYTWFNGPGKYQLTAYAPPGVYCNDSATVSVEVIAMLTPNNITGLDTVCKNTPSFYTVAPNMNGVTYNWNVSGGTIIGPNNGSSVSISWSSGGGTVSVTQTLTAPPGCTSLSSAVFVVKTWPNFPLPVITPSSSIVCLKSNVTYTIPPALISNGTYTWSVVPATAGNIITANGTNTITINWVNAAITPIWVKLKITRCYSDSVMFPINLLALPPVPNINYTPPFPCVNDLVSFTTTSTGPGWIWNWSFGDLGVSNSQNPFHAYATGGTFPVQLYVTNANGCSDTAKTTIKVNSIPLVPIITGPSSVCINSNASYTFSQPLFMGASYTWSLSAPALGSILTFSNNSVNVQWTSAGIDTVKLHLQSTCLDTTLKFVVTINPLPTPSISVPSPSCQGSPLTFTGAGGTSYSWSFTGGSANSTTIQSPVVTYSLPGTYPVTLSVVNANGCTATTTTSITINPLPLALISGPGGVCTYPTTVTLNAVVAAGYTYLWSPTSGTNSSLTYTVSSPTTFSVIVTNSFGCSKLSNAITITDGICDLIPGPCVVNDTIDFTSTPPICLSQTYTKIGGAALAGWYFGDGGSAGPISPVTHTFPYPGVFPVQVYGTATGLDGNGLPCSKIVAKTHMMTIPFDAFFEYSFQCNGANQMQTIFNNTSLYLGSATSYNWTWYDVSTASTISTVPFPSPINLSAGVHIINLYIYDPITMATCTTSHTITVPVPVVASFTVSSPVCKGTAAIFTDTSTPLVNVVSRLFDNGNSAFSSLPVCSLIYTSSGSFIAKLNVTDKYGCTSLATKPVNVNPAGTGTISIGINNCDSVQLTSSGPGPFTWNVINPPPFPTNPVYVKTSGYYSVTSYDGNGCPFTVGPVQVTVKQSPNATIVGKAQYCQGENLDIKTQTAGSSFVWQQIIPFAGVVGGNTPNLAIPLPSAGTFTYQVTVTGLNGCVSTATYTIIVDAVPLTATILGGPLTFCNGDSVVLTVSPPGATYLWSKSPTPALSGPANTYSSLTVKVSGTYSVIVQTASGCAYPAIATKTVTVNPTPPANITGDTVLCEGETLVLATTNVGGVSYAWTGPASTGNSNPFIYPNIQLTDAGIYTVVVTDVNTGCSNTDTINVIVNPVPVTPFIISNPGGVLCEGQLFNLSVVGPLGPPIVYTWNTGQIANNINAVLKGDYYVTATNQFGCSAQSNIITIHPLPDLSCAPIGCYEFCNECDSVTIPGPEGIDTYNWEMLVGNVFTFYSSTQNITVYPPGGKYRLIASNIWGCTDSTDTLKINFKDCCPPPDTVNCLNACNDFNNNNLNGFIPDPLEPNVGTNVTNVNSQGGVTDYYITATDLPGPSALLASSQFLGKWCCGTFCFDYKLIDDKGTASNVNPSFAIHNGILGFRFISSTIANVSNGWHSICAPISDCNPPPVSNLGIWVPLGGTVLSDWTTVLNNVTEAAFRVDYIASTDFEVSGIDNVCINSNVPNINAGADTTICQGSVVTLHVEGCNSTPEWYEIIPNGINFLYAGPVIDVSPQQTTCYMVICCNAGACCCDTDTICINVIPHPIITWTAQFGPLCNNSDSIFLDPYTILVNNIPLPLSGGTWVFSGPGVVGGYFYPGAPGTYVITVTYVDQYGCTASTSITITVIFCCNNSCQVDAGPDQTICAGHVAILTSQGCTGTSTWYQLGAEGPVFVGSGPTIDVTPQQNACYMVICCCIDPIYQIACCDTDTVCITVRPPMHLEWPGFFDDVCLNGDSVFLDPYNVFVDSNLTLYMIPFTGGTWYFTGVGVVGNYFHPTTLGPHVITVHYTDAFGCTGTVSKTINVINCGGCDPQSCNCNSVPPPPGPTITIISITPDNCNNSGCIHASFTGCCLLFSYTYYDPCNPAISYSVAQTSDSGIFCNLRAGTYTLYVMDACGNLVQQNVIVPSVAGPLTAILHYSNCGDSVCVIVEGGCAPYSYNWSNGSTSSCVSGFQPCTNMLVTITDSKGCSVTKVVSTPHVNFFGIINPTCCQANGRICANVCGGVTGYTYLWSNGATTPCISGLAAGQYCLYVYTPDGDVITCCYNLTAGVNTGPSVHFVFNNCGQSVTAVIEQTNCQGYSYHWENNSVDLTRGNIQGCDSVTFTVVGCDGSVYNHGFRIPHVYPTISPVNCNTGKGVICVPVECFRCAPYTYVWSPALPGQNNTSSCFVTTPGTYSVCITNACGDVICCTVYLPVPLPTTISFVTGNAPCYYNNTGFVHPTVNGGTPGYTYSWSNGATTANIDNLYPGIYTLTITDALGCTTTASATVIGGTRCIIHINVDIFLEGYYLGAGHMAPVLLNQGVAGVSGVETDTIHIELRDSLDPTIVVEAADGILLTNGTSDLTFNNADIGSSYWIVVKHRNSIQTWSSSPVLIQPLTDYNFSLSSSQAFGDNMKLVDNGIWAAYTGDVNQDEFIDIFDFPEFDLDNQNFVSFLYVSTDFNGDGFVDIFDFPVYDSNNQNFIFSIHP